MGCLPVWHHPTVDNLDRHLTIALIAALAGGCAPQNGSTDSGRQDGGTPAVLGCAPSGLQIGRTAHAVVPPAGVRASFRVLGCNGQPLPGGLLENHVAVINDERGEDFNASLEGGSRSAPAPADVAIIAVVALDMSDSIANDPTRMSEVIAGARVFVDAIASGRLQRVALIAFGRPEELEEIHSLSGDASSLNAALDALATSSSRGTTDLYGAYTHAFELATSLLADSIASSADYDERFVVVLTDGNHEAGAAEAGRAAALAAQANHPSVRAFALSVGNAFDEANLQELASSSDAYFNAADAAQVSAVFSSIAAEIQATAGSHYAIGVCTPVALGNASMTVKLEAYGQRGEFLISYGTAELTGELSRCDANNVARGGS